MQYVELVAIIAVIQFLFFGAMTARARGESGLKAPAMTGHEGFERMYRVQMNTLEIMVAFLPALLLAGKYWSPVLVAAIGMIYRNARKTSAFRPGMNSADTAGVPLVSNILIPAFAAAQCTGE
jgi:hypothetical protein